MVCRNETSRSRCCSLTRGGWVDLQWQVNEPWLAGLRLERATASHHLSGPGASRVATDAGLTPNTPVRRAAASLSWSPGRDWTLGAEAGTESSSQADVRWIGLRAMWASRHLVGGGW